jgi:hypothetical protein
MENKLNKGFWISFEIFNNKKLDSAAKILLQEIINLNSLKDGCFASNDHFGKLLNITKQAASKRITQLVELEYITTKNIFKNNNCVGRIITPNFEKIKTAEAPVSIVEKNNIPTAEAPVEIEENDVQTAEAQIEKLPISIVEENNIPTSAVLEEKPAEKILLNFEKFKLEEEEKETIERVREEEKQQEIIKCEQQEKQQEILNENLKQKTIQSKLVEDIAKQKEIINNLKETGKTNKEMLDQLFAHTLQNWIEEYEFLGNSMFCKQYKNLITDDIKIFLNYFERDLMFGRYVLNSGQFN